MTRTDMTPFHSLSTQRAFRAGAAVGWAIVMAWGCGLYIGLAFIQAGWHPLHGATVNAFLGLSLLAFGLLVFFWFFPTEVFEDTDDHFLRDG